MWGNRLGWMIAAVVLCVEALAVWAVVRMDHVSPPSAFSRNADYLAVLELPVKAVELLPEMSRNEDAGAIYREIIQIVTKDRDRYESFVDRGKIAQFSDLSAIHPLINASTYTKAGIFRDEPQAIIHFNNENPGIEYLRLVGRCGTRAALLMKDSDPAEAQKLAKAVFALSHRLIEERLTLDELRLGIELMGESTALLSKLAQARGDSTDAAKWQAAADSTASFYKSRVEPVARVLISIDPKIIGAHTGDYFYFAHHAQERVWRVEAIRAIGRLQYYVGEGGRGADQTGAKRQLKRLASDSDPVIRTAAMAARDLTVEQYRMLR